MSGVRVLLRMIVERRLLSAPSSMILTGGMRRPSSQMVRASAAWEPGTGPPTSIMWPNIDWRSRRCSPLVEDRQHHEPVVVCARSSPCRCRGRSRGSRRPRRMSPPNALDDLRDVGAELADDHLRRARCRSSGTRRAARGSSATSPRARRPRPSRSGRSCSAFSIRSRVIGIDVGHGASSASAARSGCCACSSTSATWPGRTSVVASYCVTIAGPSADRCPARAGRGRRSRRLHPRAVDPDARARRSARAARVAGLGGRGERLELLGALPDRRRRAGSRPRRRRAARSRRAARASRGSASPRPSSVAVVEVAIVDRRSRSPGGGSACRRRSGPRGRPPATPSRVQPAAASVAERLEALAPPRPAPRRRPGG